MRARSAWLLLLLAIAGAACAAVPTAGPADASDGLTLPRLLLAPGEKADKTDKTATTSLRTKEDTTSLKSGEADRPSKVADQPTKDESSGTISRVERPKQGSRQDNEDKTPGDRPKQDNNDKKGPKGGDQDNPKDDKAKEGDKTEDKPKSGGTCDGGCPTETDCVEASICQPLGNGKSKCSNPKKKNGNSCTLPGGGSGTCGGGKCKPKEEEEEETDICKGKTCTDKVTEPQCQDPGKCNTVDGQCSDPVPKSGPCTTGGKDGTCQGGVCQPTDRCATVDCQNYVTEPQCQDPGKCTDGICSAPVAKRNNLECTPINGGAASFGICVDGACNDLGIIVQCTPAGQPCNPNLRCCSIFLGPLRCGADGNCPSDTIIPGP